MFAVQTPDDRHLSGSTAPAQRPLDDIENEIATLSADIDAALCRWLCLLAEFDRRRGHEQSGFASCSRWLAWRCSLDHRAAQEKMRVARRLNELPAIRDAFSTGQLSYSKVRALTRVAEAETEADLLEMARQATAAQLERFLGAFRRATSESEYAESVANRHLSYRWEDDGSLAFSGSLPADEGALLLEALATGRESAEPDERRRSNADGLLAMAETTLAHGPAPTPGGERHQVVIHVDAGSRPGPGQPARIENGPAISAQTARRLACDASLLLQVDGPGGRGEPLSVGRKTRSIPPAIARALRSRDHGCRFPGCENQRFVDAHHITHWADGGKTEIGNLLLLCRRHHRLLHEDGYTVDARAGEGAGSAFVFKRRDGSVVPTSPQSTGGSPDTLVETNRGLDVAPGPLDAFPRSAGAPLDLDHAVFVHANRPSRRRKIPSHGREPARNPR